MANGTAPKKGAPGWIYAFDSTEWIYYLSGNRIGHHQRDPPEAMPEFPSIDALASLELRQDELLRQLDELNERIERTLRQFAPPPARPPALRLHDNPGNAAEQRAPLIAPVEMPRLADCA